MWSEGTLQCATPVSVSQHESSAAAERSVWCLQDLVVDGCTNLQRLELGRLSRLTHLGLAGCPQLQVDGVAALTALQGLALTNSGPLASQFLQHADALTGLRYFDAFVRLLALSLEPRTWLLISMIC